MGGGKPTPKTKEQEQLLIREKNEKLNKLYKSIESHPLYSERLFKEFEDSSRYLIPKKIMEQVENNEMELSKAIVELEYWLKILLIMDDERLREILVKHWKIVNKKDDVVDKEFKERKLEGEFNKIVKMALKF